MKALLALDGSPSAALTIELAANIAWPAGSTLRLVSVIETFDAAWAGAWAPGVAYDIDQQDETLTATAEGLLAQAAQSLAATGAEVVWAVIHGRPASCVVEDAASFGADLVLVGSRGHGTISSMVLGSVSSEVADHSPCPVLVARKPGMSRVLLGADGSEYSLAAEGFMTRWPIFAGAQIQAISVAQSDVAWRSGIALSAYAPDTMDETDPTHQIVADHRRTAEQAAERLRRADLQATARVVEGDAAGELIRVAREDEADLIVVGTHGRSGLARLLLGSVARNVMVHAPCSVLIVRGQRPKV